MPQRYIDLHHHILYGLDRDGPRTADETDNMLCKAAADNIGIIVATPHVAPGIRPFETVLFHARLHEANARCQVLGLDLSILPGAEIFYTPYTCDHLLAGRVPTLAGTEYVLVEFAPNETLSVIREAVTSLNRCGYSVILAHAERCICLARRPGLLSALRKEHRLFIQINAGTLLRKTSFRTGRFLRYAFQHSLVDAISTDAHNISTRATCLTEGYKAAGASQETLMRLPREIAVRGYAARKAAAAPP